MAEISTTGPRTPAFGRGLRVAPPWPRSPSCMAVWGNLGAGCIRWCGAGSRETACARCSRRSLQSGLSVRWSWPWAAVATLPGLPPTAQRNFRTVHVARGLAASRRRGADARRLRRDGARPSLGLPMVVLPVTRTNHTTPFAALPSASPASPDSSSARRRRFARRRVKFSLSPPTVQTPRVYAMRFRRCPASNLQLTCWSDSAGTGCRFLAHDGDGSQEIQRGQHT